MPHDITIAIPQISKAAAVVPELWEKQGKRLDLMFHAFFWDGESALIGVDQTQYDSISHDPDAMKLFVANAVRDFCRDKKPAAIVSISEAFLRRLPNDGSIDMSRITDPVYLGQVRRRVKPQLCLMFNVESLYGSKMYMWDIIRDGDEMSLGPLRTELHERNETSKGDFDNLLSPPPEQPV